MQDGMKFVQAAGLRTRYIETGDGPRDIVLLHGGGRHGLWRPSAWAWERNLAAMSRHARTFAVDAPGHGETARPPTAPVDIETIVAHVCGFVAAVGARRPHLVGHDEGGLAALLAALRRPQDFASVTVVGSCAAPTGDGLPNLALAAPPHPLLSRQSQAWTLERCSHDPHHVTEGLLLQEATRLAAAAAPEDCVRAATALRGSLARAKSELFARLRDEGLQVPVLLLWGQHDPLVPLEHAIALYELVRAGQRQAQLRVVNRAGNLPFREQPADFDRLLDSFVTGL